MKRRTVMLTQVVVEEHVKLNKQQIKKRIKLTRSIAAGINIGIVVLSAVVIIAAIMTTWNIMQSRIGTFGGEIFILPALGIAFTYGVKFGRCFTENYEDGVESGRYIDESEDCRRA